MDFALAFIINADTMATPEAPDAERPSSNCSSCFSSASRRATTGLKSNVVFFGGSVLDAME